MGRGGLRGGEGAQGEGGANKGAGFPLVEGAEGVFRDALARAGHIERLAPDHARDAGGAP